MNQKWLSICEKYVDKYGSLARSVQLSILLWVSRTEVIPEFNADNYKDFSSALEGLSPYKGRWAKSPVKTKGAERPDNDPTCFSFEEFWTMFAYSKGNKKDTKVIWNKLNEEDRLAVKTTLPFYVAETTTVDLRGTGAKYKDMRLHPKSYLNGRRWDAYMDRATERSFVAPKGGAYEVDYNSYLVRTNSDFPKLKESYLRLCYEEYQQLRERFWEDEFKVNLGTSALKVLLDEAHKQINKGTTVFQNFKELLIAKK